MKKEHTTHELGYLKTKANPKVINWNLTGTDFHSTQMWPELIIKTYPNQLWLNPYLNLP